MNVAICPECGTGNRIAAGHEASAAKCGKCGAKVFQGKPLDVDDAKLQQHLRLTKAPKRREAHRPWSGANAVAA